MRKVFAFLLISLLGLLTGSVFAQTAPDYTVFFIARQLSTDGTQVEANFVVSNGGGDATQPAVTALGILGEQDTLAVGKVPALESGSTHSLTMAFPVSAVDASPDQNLTFELTITSPELGEIQRLAEFSIPSSQVVIPPGATKAPPTNPPQIETPTTTTDENTVAGGIRERVESWLGFLPFAVDLTNRTHQLIGVGVLAVLVIIIWLMTVIFRAIFSTKPSFPPHPPPYAGMQQMHPDTLPGRRQMWQFVAQHGSMFAEESEGNLHARKLLMGADDIRFSGWKVVGIRASQYDTYGRIARTQVIAGKSQLRKLNAAISRATVIPEDAARKRVRPVALNLARQLNRRINKRVANLPVAVDVKFRGAHGEVNIVFELYQFQMGGWRRLDSWQPEMTVSSRSLYEFYTYTIYGMNPGESMGDFRKRMREEMIYLLTEMVMCTPPLSGIQPTTPPPMRPPQSASAGSKKATSEHKRVNLSAPTTTSMRPVPPAESEEEASLMDTIVRSKPLE
jgi:hypothetical protein